VNVSVKALLAILATTSACALTSRGEPVRWQYYTPERVQPTLESANIAVGPHDVCIGRVAGASSGRRIAYGDGRYELNYYEDRRWTDEPERYVRRALERTLFEQSGFHCDPTRASGSLDALGGPSAATLAVDVLKFEEVKTPARHDARVALRAVLATDRVLFDATIEAVEPVVGSSFDAVVAAIGRSLDNASAQVARRTGSALSAK
jgi:cholesterol transport system auxiliary component